MREGFYQEERDAFVEEVLSMLLNGVEKPILSNSFAHLKNIDKEVGKLIETKVRLALTEKDAHVTAVI
ncbi:MAG: hypothetical protein Q4P66_00715 [Actinomycetaceae bacterium]|nr:hypothetical protein [Actinomycetaceae bacterium]